MEAIATLCHVKRVMADLLLRPAGVPEEVLRPLLYRRDETGRFLSKRQIAPLIVEGCDQQAGSQRSIRRIIEIAATWSSFHLADDEYAARATVQKAREVLGIIETMEAREARAREIARQEELGRMARERADILKRQSELLPMMFDELARSDDAQRRGYLLQDLLNRLFDTHELDGLLGQVNRSGKQTMGLFLSINGWSDHVPRLLKQNPDKCIFLMDGYDLRCALALEADLRELLVAKLAHLNLEAEPFLGVRSFLDEFEGI
jgi:hypothetical protein